MIFFTPPSPQKYPLDPIFQGGGGKKNANRSVQSIIHWPVTQHVRPYFFQGLSDRKAFKENFKVGMGLNLLGLGGSHQGKEHGAGIRTLGYVGKEPVFPAQSV